MMSSFWVILHGDTEKPGLYWSGYKPRPIKDHTFSKDLKDAIKFFDEDSAKRAGLHVTKGILIKEVTE